MTSTVTVVCWGCNKSETHPLVHGEENDKQKEEMASRGWVRRSFYPSPWDKGPWFCSTECAYESYNAKRAEEYHKELANHDPLDMALEKQREREFHKYCKETPLPRWFVFLISFTAGFLLTSMITQMLIKVFQ